MPGIESEWVALTRDYDTLAASYRELLSKSENSKMAASLEQRQIGEQFRILDPPRVPLKPNSPNRARINLMGTLAGLGVGVLLLGLTYFRDSTMRSEADVLGAIELPVLVLLPFVATEADLRRQKRRRWMTWAAAVAAFAGTAALVWFLRLWRFVVWRSLRLASACARVEVDPGRRIDGTDRRSAAPREPGCGAGHGSRDARAARLALAGRGRTKTATAPGPRAPRERARGRRAGQAPGYRREYEPPAARSGFDAGGDRTARRVEDGGAAARRAVPEPRGHAAPGPG